MDAASRPRQSRAPVMTGVLGMIVLAGLVALTALSSADNRQEPVRLSNWSPDAHVRIGGATALLTRIDFVAQMTLSEAGEQAFVLPLTEVPVAGEPVEMEPPVVGALLYPGQSTLSDTELEDLLADLRAMTLLGPIVSVPARFVSQSPLSPAISEAFGDRMMGADVPLFRMRDRRTGGVLMTGLWALAATLTFGSVAAFVVQGQRAAAIKVAPPAKSVHYSISTYIPQMVTGEDGRPALYKTIRPLSRADRPIEVYSVTSVIEEIAPEPAPPKGTELDPALIEAFAVERPVEEDTVDPAEEIQAAVRAAEERRKADAEAQQAKLRAEAEAKRQAQAQQQSEDEALAILSSVAATVATVAPTPPAAQEDIQEPAAEPAPIPVQEVPVAPAPVEPPVEPSVVEVPVAAAPAEPVAEAPTPDGSEEELRPSLASKSAGDLAASLPGGGLRARAAAGDLTSDRSARAERLAQRRRRDATSDDGASTARDSQAAGNRKLELSPAKSERPAPGLRRDPRRDPSAGPSVRPLDAPHEDRDLMLDAAALAATLDARPDDDALDQVDDGGQRQGKIDRSALLVAARLGESSRLDLGLTARETKRVERDPFVKRLDKLN